MAAVGQSLLAIRAGDRTFGIPVAMVREVSRLPDLTPVPHAPPSLLGLGNVRSEPIAIVSLARLLDLPDANPRQMLLLGADRRAALAVDRIDGVVAKDADCDVPDYAALLDSAFPVRTAHALTRGGTARAVAGTVEDRIALLSFAIGDQLFALPVEAIETVMRLPGAVTQLPHSDAATLGTMKWGDRILPLFSLAALLALESDPGASPRVIVARVAGHYIGLLVDRVDTLERPLASRVEPLPATLLRGGKGEAILQAIVRPEGEGRLISVLAADQLLDAGTMALLPTAPRQNRDGDGQQAAATEPLLLFRHAGQRFALPLTAVHEVLRVPASFAPLPHAPDFVRGLTSHRGSALIVLDLTAQLAPGAAAGQKARLLVVAIAGAEAALLVEAVEGIVRVPATAIAEAPPLGGERTAVIGRTVSLDAGETITLILSADDMFAQIERDLVAEIVSRSARAT